MLRQNGIKIYACKRYTEGMKAPRGVKDYNPPEGWYKSEKLDGYRAQTDKEDDTIKSRNGKLYICPKWFMDAMVLMVKLSIWMVNCLLVVTVSTNGCCKKKVPIDKNGVISSFMYLICLI